MIGRLVDLVVGRNGKQRVTLEIDGDFRQQYDEFSGKDLDIIVKQHRNKRSLDANAYCWVLIDKIAEATGADKELIYKSAIRSIGGVSDIVLIKTEAAETFCKNWQRQGIGWQTETMPSKTDGWIYVIVYAGSSAYNTRQMSALIDSLVEDAKGLGIETATPEQIAKYKDLWEDKQNDSI